MVASRILLQNYSDFFFLDMNDYVDIDEILESGLKLDFNKPPFRQKQQQMPEETQQNLPQMMVPPPQVAEVDLFPSQIDYISIDDTATMALKNVCLNIPIRSNVFLSLS
jgi:hypothetical protein